MEEEVIICLNCGWSGDISELESKTHDVNDSDYIYCPVCGSGNIEDFE